MATYIKDPDAVLDYHLDWSGWLDGDTITTSTWAVDTAGITIDSAGLEGGLATVWLSGGAVGQQYRVTNHIVTAAGRADDRTLTVSIRER